MLNQEMRTLELTRLEMCDIRRALTCVMCDLDRSDSSRKYWARLRDKVIAQLEAQDPPDDD